MSWQKKKKAIKYSRINVNVPLGKVEIKGLVKKIMKNMACCGHRKEREDTCINYIKKNVRAVCAKEGMTQ